jgi:5-methylcytosine-specific restriction protein A
MPPKKRKRKTGSRKLYDADLVDPEVTPLGVAGRGGASSRRVEPMPAGWTGERGTQKRVLRRDNYVCQIALVDRCLGAATEVDHILAAARGGGDEMENLQAVCSECHAWKTGREAALIRHEAAKKARRRDHPGLIE